MFDFSFGQSFRHGFMHGLFNSNPFMCGGFNPFNSFTFFTPTFTPTYSPIFTPMNFTSIFTPMFSPAFTPTFTPIFTPLFTPQPLPMFGQDYYSEGLECGYDTFKKSSDDKVSNTSNSNTTSSSSSSSSTKTQNNSSNSSSSSARTQNNSSNSSSSSTRTQNNSSNSSSSSAKIQNNSSSSSSSSTKKQNNNSSPSNSNTRIQGRNSTPSSQTNYNIASLKSIWKKKKADLPDEFYEKVIKISKNINCSPNDLMAVMYLESKLNHKVKCNYNKSTAVGLIQFTEDTRKELNVSEEELITMTNVEQLDYVEKYLKSAKKQRGFKENEKIDDTTLYALVFLPSRVRKEVLSQKGDRFYNGNEGLDENKDGKITKTEVHNKLKSYYS